MQHRIAWLAVALACAGAGAGWAEPMTKQQYKAQQMRLEDEYSQAKQRCKGQEGNARDVCREQARGDRDIAMAELQFRWQPTVATDQKLRMAKADAAYAVAMQRCKEMPGSARGVCRQDAHQVLAEAKTDASLQKEVVAEQLEADDTVRENSERDEKIAQAEFNAANQRCAMLPESGREPCLADVRKRFDR